MADIEAHITGNVWKVEVAVGDEVSDGDTVVIAGMGVKPQSPLGTEAALANDSEIVREVLHRVPAPVTLRIAAQYADQWHTFGAPDDWARKSAILDDWCARVGRDPASIGRSVGVYVHPLDHGESRPSRLPGPAERIADGIRAFRGAGYTQVELMYSPPTMAALDALAPVVEALRADGDAGADVDVVGAPA